MKNDKEKVRTRSIGPITALKFDAAMAKARAAGIEKQMHEQTAQVLLAQHGVSYADVVNRKLVIETETGNVYTQEEYNKQQLSQMQEALEPEAEKETPKPIPLPRVENGNGKRAS